MVLNETFLNGYCVWRVVTQQLWSLTNHFTTIITFDESLLNNDKAWQIISQWLLCLTNHYSTVMMLNKPFLNGYRAWCTVSQWLLLLMNHFSMVATFNKPSSLVIHNFLSNIRRPLFFYTCDWGSFQIFSSSCYIFLRIVNNIGLVILLLMLLCYGCVVRLLFFHHANNHIGQDSFKGRCNLTYNNL